HAAGPLAPRIGALLLGPPDPGDGPPGGVSKDLRRRHRRLCTSAGCLLRRRGRAGQLAGPRRQRVRDGASLGGLGRNLDALPAHGGPAGNSVVLQHAAGGPRRRQRRDRGSHQPARFRGRRLRPAGGPVDPPDASAQQPEPQPRAGRCVSFRARFQGPGQTAPRAQRHPLAPAARARAQPQPDLIVNWLLTEFTPLTPRAISLARSRAVAEGAGPLKVTTPFCVSTSILMALKSLSAARLALTLAVMVASSTLT